MGTDRFKAPQALVALVDELLTRYPQKRSAALMVLHAIQDRWGWISRPALEWAANKLEVRPLHLYELLTFYPMFRQEPAGTYQFKVCRTLSCALAGAPELHDHLCRRLGLDPKVGGLQTTPDGRFSVEFVECLASCGTAPVILCNDSFHETMTREGTDRLLQQCQ